MRAAQFAVREAVRVGGLSSAHDIAEGGLAVALAECCLAGGLGAEVRLDALAGESDEDGEGDDPVQTLFGEAPGGFLVSGISTGVRALGRRTRVRVIGSVGPDALRIKLGELSLSATLDELTEAHASLA